MEISDLMIGIAGEHIVCADLIVKGHRAFLSDQGLPYDLLLDLNGKIIKIQAKTTRTHRVLPQRKSKAPGYIYNIKRCGKNGAKRYQDSDVDIFALVALDTKEVGYICSKDVKDTIQIRVEGFRGRYGSDIQDANFKKVLDLKSDNLTYAEISRRVGIAPNTVKRILTNNSKEYEKGIYFSDITLDKALKSFQ